MKARHIYCALAAAAMTLAGCSDNYDTAYEPTRKPLGLKVDGHEGAFTMDCSAAPGNYEVSVESNTLWRVEAASTGGWISLDKVSGRGSESFTFSVRDNMLEDRRGSVTVYMVDAEGISLDTPGSSITITVHQDVSAVRLSPSSLAPFKPAGNERTLFTVTANVAWTLDVSYEDANSAGFITITPGDGEMHAEANGTFAGSGEATFHMSVADNRTASDRKAFLTLRGDSDTGTYTVEITQSRSDYTFDVTPSENRVVAAEGGSIDFGVLSISGWRVESSAPWITFSVASYPEGSDSRVMTAATVAPNSDGLERTANVMFIPTDDRYQGLGVTVIQRGYDAAFGVSRSDSEGVVMDGGGRLRLELDSRFDWSAEAPSWLGLSAYSGDASASIRTVDVSVDANRTNDSRTGFITVTPLPTVFPGGVTLDPTLFNLGEVRIGVTQFGGREPAISVPWLRDGYTQESATVEFNYYSPYYAITELGLEYAPEGSADTVTVTVTPKDAKEGTASFELRGLRPASGYVARGYVRDDQGNVKYGDWSYPFTTAGQYPGAGDNPTPTR